MTDFVANFFKSPLSFPISFMNFDEIISFSISDIKKMVSIFLSSFLFIPANWNSYSKSETALNPLIIKEALYFLQIFIVKSSNDIIFILFLFNFKSTNKDVAITINHKDYKHSTVMNQETKDELSKDFSI